jgi:hypothetical protein
MSSRTKMPAVPHSGAEGRAEIKRVVEVGESVVSVEQGRHQADGGRLGPGRPQPQGPVGVVEGGDHLVGRDGGGEGRQGILWTWGHRSVLKKNQLIFHYFCITRVSAEF